MGWKGDEDSIMNSVKYFLFVSQLFSLSVSHYLRYILLRQLYP